MKGIRLLLLFFPVAVVAELLHWGDLIVFASAALAIVPIAGLLGEATESLAEKTGPQIGGLLNASLGNAADSSPTFKSAKTRTSSTVFPPA